MKPIPKAFRDSMTAARTCRANLAYARLGVAGKPIPAVERWHARGIQEARHASRNLLARLRRARETEAAYLR